MWSHTAATLRFAARSPMTWVLLLGAAFAGWFASAFDVLALDEAAAAAESVVAATAQFAGAILVAWLVTRILDDDAASGWTAAADATRTGARARHLGRWLGAVTAASAVAVGAALLVGLLAGSNHRELLSLLSTTIVAIALVGAWAALLSTRWRGGGVILIVALVWFAGHLPWGHASFVPGVPGQIVRAWLPSPDFDISSWRAWLQHGLAAAGLLWGCCALARPGAATT